MEEYLEQSVAEERTARGNLLYALSWTLIAVLLFAALICAVGIIGSDGEGLHISWLKLLLAAGCLGLAFLVFRRKDSLRMEYDYLLQGDALEISAIYNNKRRKVCASIPLEAIERFGRAEGADYEAAQRQPGLKKHAWHVRGEGVYYICYVEESQRHMALLELNDAMAAGIRTSRSLRRDAWRGEGSYK